MTYSLVIVGVDKARVEATTEFHGRARVAVIARDYTVVLGLEVELKNIIFLSCHRVGVECVVLGRRDLDCLGVGQVDHGR